MRSRARVILDARVLANAAVDDSTRRNFSTLRPTSRGKIVSQDLRGANALEAVDRVARSTCTVLVTGESGTAKELAVAALHDASHRCNAELVTINCLNRTMLVEMIRRPGIR